MLLRRGCSFGDSYFDGDAMKLTVLNLWQDFPIGMEHMKFWLNAEKTVGWYSVTVFGLCFMLML